MSIDKKLHEINLTEINELKQKCPRLSLLIDHVGTVESYYIPDYFSALINNIVYQSISYVAATSVWERLLQLFPSLTPEAVLSKSVEEIKDVGLSTSKAMYIHNIATAFLIKSIRLDFDEMSNEEVQSELQKIKGIGPWSSEMFLIFCLYRKDVFSYGDIAIRRGIEWLYDINHDLTREEFGYYRKLYEPHLTITSFYLWEITLQKLTKKINSDFTFME